MKKKLLILLLLFPFFAFAQGAMDFEGVELPTVYSDGSFEADGISYTYGHSRDQENFAINEQGLMLRYPGTSYLEWTVPNGMGQLSFQYRKAYSGGNARQLEVYVNDEVVVTTDEFGADSGVEEDIYTLTHNVNLEGELTIKIKNVGTITQNRQTVIDNIAWTAYDAGGSDNGDGEAVEATIQLGSGNSTNVYLPFYYLYDHSYTQTIYTAEELHSAGAQMSGGPISMISYLPNSSVSTVDWRDVKIFMANVAKEGFTSNSDWVAASELTLVFDGQFQDNAIAGEWMDLTLDTPFNWDGSSNILVAVTENTDGWGGNPSWRSYTSTPSTGNKAIYAYRDNSVFDINNPPSANNATSNVAQIQFHGALQTACSGTPDGGTLANSLEICSLNPIDLAAEGYTTGEAGLVYHWEISSDATSWEAIEGADTPSYTYVQGVDEETYFRFAVTCEASGQTDYSNNLHVTLAPGLDCYCTPTGMSNNTAEIRSFTLGDLTNASDANENTGTIGYADYTDTVDPIVLTEGLPYVATITVGADGGNHGAAIWIDYNDDGAFSDDERVTFIGNTIGANATVDFPEFVAAESLGVHRLRIMYVYNKAGDLMDPCVTGHSYSEVEDYLVEIIEGVACAGTPDAGTINEDFSICAGNEFSLVAEGYETDLTGLVYQWEVSTDEGDTWTAIEGANTTSYTAEEGIDEAAMYRFAVTCTNSEETAYSNTTSVSLNPANECYCTPTINYTGDHLSAVNTEGAEENASYTGGNNTPYADETAQEVKVIPGTEVTINTTYSGGNNTVAIFVDWNQNGSFEDSEMIQSNGPLVQTNQLVISQDAEAGSYRLRIRATYDYSGTKIGENISCTNENYGTTVDFTLVVISLEPCESAVAGTIEGDGLEICSNTEFTLTVTGDSEPAEGLTKVWQSSPAGENDWTDIEGATTSTLMHDGVLENTDFRFAVSCEEDTDYSNIVTVSLNPGTECYCVPTGASNNGDEIRNFTLSNIDNSSGASENNTDTPGYSDYTETVDAAILEVGESYVASLTSGTGSGNHGAAIWIDYNDDGFFDSSEMVAFLPSQIGSNETVDFPAFEIQDANGVHRLRVAYRWNMSGEDLDPCHTTSGYTEFEDYLVEVVGGTDVEPCEAPEDFDAEFYEDGVLSVMIDGEGDYEVLYGEEGFDPAGTNGTSVLTDGVPIVEIEDLEPGVYDVYVRTVCGDDLYSDWAGPVTAELEAEVVGGECEWTVHVWGTGYMDEVSWQLIGNDGQVLLEVEEDEYFMFEDDTQTVVAEGPVTFVISAEGFFGDNVANFTVSNANGIIVSGVVDGDTQTYSDLTCADEALEPCDGTPEAGVVSITPEFGPDDTIIEFTAEGYSEGYGISYVIEYRFNNGIWQELAVSDPVLNLTVNGDEGDVVEMRLVVTCDFSNQSATSNTAVFTIGEEPVDEPCEAPEDFDVDSFEEGSFTVMIDGEADYEVLYGPEGFDPDGTEGTSVLTEDVPIVDVEGLEDGVYDVYVRTVCENAEYSDWVGPVSIELETEVEEPCEVPTGFSSIYNEELDQVSVVVNDSSNIYEVVLGPEGFDPDSEEATSVFTEEGEPIAVFTGPFEDGNYDIYVRTVCGDDQNSDWIGPEAIEILGIADVLFENFKFYPNPVQDVLSLDANSVITQVEVCNLLGQKVMQEQPNNLQAQINLSDLQSGTYLLKVSIEGVDRSFHLIKK